MVQIPPRTVEKLRCSNLLKVRVTSTETQLSRIDLFLFCVLTYLSFAKMRVCCLVIFNLIFTFISLIIVQFQKQVLKMHVETFLLWIFLH